MKVLIAPVIYINCQCQADYAVRSLETFKSKSNDIFIRGVVNRLDDNYKHILDLFDGYVDNEYNCLSLGWNRSIDYALKNRYDYCLIPNLDVEFKDDTIDKLVSFAESHRDAVMYSCYCVNHSRYKKPDDTYLVDAFSQNNYDTYSAFMVGNDFHKIMGKFDEHYQAYCEDIDMEHRINLTDNKHWTVRDSEFVHHEHITLNTASNARRLDATHTGAFEYFIRKWGAAPRKQIYKFPFNDYNLDVNYTDDYLQIKIA